MFFSLIIPVYNRPDEVDELLMSLSQMEYHDVYEIVIIEDGSTIKCQEVLEKYADKLNIRYYKLHKQLLWDNAPWYKKFTRFIIGWDYKYFCTLCKFPNFKSVDLVESLRGLNKPIVFDNSCLGIIN